MEPAPITEVEDLRSDQPYEPVARFLSPDERDRSLQHLMLAAGRPHHADEDIDPRGRRRFGFVCGRCGARHVARVYDIAAEMECWRCAALLIVPAPIEREAAAPEISPGQDTLYCPQCGTACRANRTRATGAYCTACARWF